MARRPIAFQAPVRHTLDLTALIVGDIAPSLISVDHDAQLMDLSHWTIRL